MSITQILGRFQVGQYVQYNGHEWQIVRIGDGWLRLQRGYGDNLSVVIVTPEDIQR